MSGSGISKSAPRSRQITMPAPHHSVFYWPDALPATQPTASKHWRQNDDNSIIIIIITTFYSRVVAKGHIAAAIKHIRLRISAAGKSGHVFVYAPKVPLFVWFCEHHLIIHGSLFLQDPYTERHHDRLSHFCGAHSQQEDHFWLV